MVHHGYGTPWYTTVRLRCVMVYCCTMIYHGFLPWFTTVYHGAPSMVSHSLPWHTMMYHMTHTRLCYGVPWYTIVHHTIPWCTTVPLCSRLYHGLPWFTMVCHGTPWHMVNYGTTAMCYDMVVPWYGIPWYTTVYHGISWYTMFALKIRGGPLT